MTPKERELHQIVDTIVSKTPVDKFRRTLRGLRTDKLEFIFSTDRMVIDDDNILVLGKKENYLTNPVIRKKLINIFEACPKRRLA